MSNTQALASENQQIARPPLHAHKPSLPVSVTAKVPTTIEAGQTVTIPIDITSALEEGNLSIRLVALDSLELVSPQEDFHFALTPGGFSTAVNATVIAPEEGIYGLSVEISHSYAGKTRSVVRGVTLRVGASGRVSSKAKTVTENGAEPVVSMPAEEQIQR